MPQYRWHPGRWPTLKIPRVPNDGLAGCPAYGRHNTFLRVRRAYPLAATGYRLLQAVVMVAIIDDGQATFGRSPGVGSLANGSEPTCSLSRFLQKSPAATSKVPYSRDDKRAILDRVLLVLKIMTPSVESPSESLSRLGKENYDAPSLVSLQAQTVVSPRA